MRNLSKYILEDNIKSLQAVQEYSFESKEDSFFDGDGWKMVDLGEYKGKPLSPMLQKFISKYDFKPVFDNEELCDAVRYTYVYPSKGYRIGIYNYYKELKDGSFLILVPDSPSRNSKNYTGVSYFAIWKQGNKTKWIISKAYGIDGYIKSPKEAEEMILNNKLDKKFK
jgi:hypothetical protein